MKRDFRLGFESLANKVLLSSNPWYVDAINAENLWSSIQNSSRPVVAIIDSGVDLNHPALKDHIWHNPYDVADGVDNDGNGFVDDVVGWNFVSNNNNPQDGYYHGTHLAGIIENVSNNSLTIMPLKFMNDSGSGYTGAAVSAINYAVQMKLRGENIVAINCSWGGLTSMSSSVGNAIKNASDNGIIVVMAAGNNGDNNDITPRYPGSYSYTNTITVGAINPDNTLAGYSNYGESVTVDAPGTSIYSTLPNNSYGYVSGTSMSTAVVTGAVGLLNELGHYGASVIKNAITYGCDMIDGLVGKVHYGLINLAKSMSWLKTQPQTVVSKPIVSIPTAPPVAPVVSLAYKITTVSNIVVKGWANLVNSNTKPVVEIYINKVLRYSVSANQYRSDTRLSNGFSVSINRKFLTLRSNLVEVKIKDSLHRLEAIAYKGYIRR